MSRDYLRKMEDEGEYCTEHEQWFIDFCRECDHEHPHPGGRGKTTIINQIPYRMGVKRE